MRFIPLGVSFPSTPTRRGDGEARHVPTRSHQNDAVRRGCRQIRRGPGSRTSLLSGAGRYVRRCVTSPRGTALAEGGASGSDDIGDRRQARARATRPRGACTQRRPRSTRARSFNGAPWGASPSGSSASAPVGRARGGGGGPLRRGPTRRRGGARWWARCRSSSRGLVVRADHLRRRGGPGPYTFDANLALNVVAQALMVVATGGRQPLGADASHHQRDRRAPHAPRDGGGGGARAGSADRGAHDPPVVGRAADALPERFAQASPAALVAGALLRWRARWCWCSSSAGRGGARALVRATLAGVLRDVDGARTAQLDEHLEQNRALTTLTAEIAPRAQRTRSPR